MGESTPATRPIKSYNGSLMARGTANEDVIMEWLRTAARDIIDFRDFRLTQHIDVDCGIESIDGDIQLAEIKSDKHLKQDGNLLFECFRVNHFVEEHWFYLGWGWRSPAQKLIIRNPYTGYTIVFDFTKLRHKIGRLIKQEGKPFKRRIDVVETDDQKTTFNFLLPLSSVEGLFKEYSVDGQNKEDSNPLNLNTQRKLI